MHAWAESREEERLVKLGAGSRIDLVRGRMTFTAPAHGRHATMPLHEISFDVAGWNERHMAYATTRQNPLCLAGALPGRSALVVVPI